MTEQKLNTFDNLSALLESEVPITKEQSVSNIYRVFIDDEIGNGTTYRSLITLLNSASEDDVFVFHLASPGGEVDTAYQIYLAMQSTQAHTVAQVDGYAASAATFFVMAAKQVLVSEHGYMMVHGATCGYIGHMQQLKTTLAFQDARIRKLIYDVYEGFMTEDELTDMIENQKDLYFSSDEIINRLHVREELRQKSLEDAMIELEPQSPKKRTTRKKTND